MVKEIDMSAKELVAGPALAGIYSGEFMGYITALCIRRRMWGCGRRHEYGFLPCYNTIVVQCDLSCARMSTLWNLKLNMQASGSQ